MTITYMGKTHIFPYEIGPYKRNKYVVERFLRGLTSERWAGVCLCVCVLYVCARVHP